MGVISIFLEWLGVLFLSIEAIKIDNFKSLTEKFINIKIALNPTFSFQDGNVLVPVAPKGYEFLRKYSNIIIFVIGLVTTIILLTLTKYYTDVIDLIKKYLLQFSNISFFRGLLNVLGLLSVLFFIPFYIGNELVILFSHFAFKYASLMYKLEKNTYNGIIGVIGFLLVTLSFIIQLSIR